MNVNGLEERDDLDGPENEDVTEAHDLDQEHSDSVDRDGEERFRDPPKHHKRHRFDDADRPEKHDHKKRDAGKRRFHPKQREGLPRTHDEVEEGD